MLCMLSISEKRCMALNQTHTESRTLIPIKNVYGYKKDCLLSDQWTLQNQQKLQCRSLGKVTYANPLIRCWCINRKRSWRWKNWSRLAMDITHYSSRHFLTLIDCCPSWFMLWRLLGWQDCQCSEWNDKIVALKKTTLQFYFKTFIEKINSANLIM